jgi:photosystem II stability/assembly factor-like uncharacterized protein
VSAKEVVMQKHVARWALVGIGIGSLALGSVELLAQANPGSEPTWTTSWPSLGEASSLTLDLQNSSHLFAGTDLGIATSEDGGRSWNVLPDSPRLAVTLALDPSNASRLFSGSGDGIFLTTDGGAHFSQKLAQPTYSMAIDPSDPQTIYSGSSGTLVGKSSDGGTNWTSTKISTGLVRSIASLVVDPQDGRRVLAGTAPKFEFEDSYYYYAPAVVGSLDAGQSWLVFLDNTGPARTVAALAFDPRDNGVVYAAKGNYVYRSTTRGMTWVPGTFSLGSRVTSLVVDSVTPDTIYAGTDHGVFRSVDAGAHWTPLPILPSMDVRAIALDAPGQVLHAATGSGVYETALTAEGPSFPCQPSPDALCVLGSRFRVRARAWDPRTARFTTGHAVGETDSYGYFSLPEFTGDASLPEVLVKMVDAEVPPWNADWVFHGGLTDLWYVLTITDTVTGETRSYENSPDQGGCGGADISAFPPAPAGLASMAASLRPLTAGSDALALLSGRFQLTLSATDPRSGRVVSGHVIPRQDAFGYFSLPDLTGDDALPEVFVKMLDGRSLTHTFWLFATGLTDVSYTLTVLDTTTGATRTYQSPGPFCGTTDTAIPDGP